MRKTIDRDNVPLNKRLSIRGCWEMVNRVNTFEKLEIARHWIYENEVISIEDYNDLMLALSYKSREMYNERG